jgi:tetratricopeptide (TPR) repeat protein
MKTKHLYLGIAFFLMPFLTTLAQQKVNDALLLDMYQNQKFAEAAIYLKSTYPEPVTDMKVLSRIAYTYQMAGKLPDAEAYYIRMLTQDSTSVPVLFNLANINVKRENNVKAIAYYQKIIGIESANFMAYKQLGKLYFETNDKASQLKYLQKANKLNPVDDEVAAILSSNLIDLKQYKPAQKILTKALAADTDNLMLLRSLMKLMFTQDKFAETVKLGEQIINLGDISYGVIGKVGEAYFKLKNYQCCIETFALLPGIFQNESSYYFTAESYKALKNYPLSIAFFEQTLLQSISPNVALYYSEMADTFDEMNKPKNAALTYQKSLFFKEKDIVFYTLANLYDTKLKDKKNALKYYKKYLDSKPPEKQKAYIVYVQSRIMELKK